MGAPRIPIFGLETKKYESTVLKTSPMQVDMNGNLVLHDASRTVLTAVSNGRKRTADESTPRSGAATVADSSKKSNESISSGKRKNAIAAGTAINAVSLKVLAAVSKNCALSFKE